MATSISNRDQSEIVDTVVDSNSKTRLAVDVYSSTALPAQIVPDTNYSFTIGSQETLAVSLHQKVSVNDLNKLVPEEYDYLLLTYVSSGNGIGEVETVTYKTGGSGGTTVATLTLTYDGDDKVSSVART